MEMKQKFPALGSNVRVRNLILKNRMGSSASTPHMLQGREPYPTDRVIAHFANRAKSGAAMVTINHLTVDTVPFPGRVIDDPPAHFNMFDLDDPSSVYSSVGVGKLEGLVDGTIRSDGVTKLVHQKNDDIDKLCDEFDAATTFDDSVAAAKKLDQALMAQHYYLMVSYGQKWDCFYMSRVHGLDGALLTAGFWTGYMIARTWVTDES